jgi:hypothetical protein
MTSEIETKLEACLPTIFAAAGTAVNYTPAGGSAKQVPALLEPMSEHLIEGDERQRAVRRLIATIRRDAETGIAEPALTDQIEISGETFAVEGLLERTAGTARLALVGVETRMIRDPSGAMRTGR